MAKGTKKSSKKNTSFFTEIFDYTKDNLLFLSALAFLVASTTALVLTQYKKEEVAIEEANEVIAEKIFTPIPVLTDSASFPIISAQGALVVDLDTMIPLYEKNPEARYLPASTTKIVTALVAMEYFPTDMVITVDGLRVDGQNMGLVTGEKITAGDLIEALLVYSANDAAEILAENYPDGRDAFISAMNKKAVEYHLENTNFENPTGFDGESHYMTAEDLVRIAMIAMKNPKFAEIVSKDAVLVESIDGKYIHNLKSTNKLLNKVDGVIGVKTGWTEDARENLVTYIERDEKKIMIALLGSQDRFGETEELIDWLFANYIWEEVKYPAS
jgi:D-alanyl-D-alanine carboxypeptidase (penicillin-binding protein 5/6)